MSGRPWLVLLRHPRSSLLRHRFLLFAVSILEALASAWVTHVHGGFGIMLDDLLAAVYAIVVLSFLMAIVGHSVFEAETLTLAQAV